jgi:hypothetical protein
MPKKSRKTRAKKKAISKSPQESRASLEGRKPPDKETVSAPRPVTPTRSQSYDYVFSELKRIGIIAGFLVLIIIALTFILN